MGCLTREDGNCDKVKIACSPRLRYGIKNGLVHCGMSHLQKII